MFHAGSSVIEVPARNWSTRGLVVRAMALASSPLLALGPLPEVTLFLSSLSLSRSLELMYISPFWDRTVDFLPQLSYERFLFTSGDETGDNPRSTERLPMLRTSASLDAHEPLDDGREEDLPLRKLRSPPLSRLSGDFGAVRGENPLGGFAVLMVGGRAARSSKAASSSRNSASVGWLSPP